MGGCILRVQLKREPANRTPVLAVGAREALPIAFEQGEDAVDRLSVSLEDGADDERIEQVAVGTA